jgi:hypothetical protein
METKTTQWAAKSELADERDSRVPSPPTEFLIANLELEFRLTCRKLSPLRISNRKKTTVLRAPWRIAILDSATRSSSRHPTQWDRHSCLSAVAKPWPQRLANAAASLSAHHHFSNRDTAIRISPNLRHCNSFPISNRDKMRVLCPQLRIGLFSLANTWLSQVTPHSKFPAQIDHTAPHAYTGPSAEGESSWKIPSY